MGRRRGVARRPCRAGALAATCLVATALAAAPPPAAPSGGAPESGKTFDAPGATLYYEVRGGGPGTPLFLANGGPGFDHVYLHTSDVWDELARGRPVVFWDQRGNGRSPALAKDQSCSLADQIADLDALRAHLGYERIDLLGHSWGGYLAMAYAARHPDRVAHLVICDSAAPRWADTRFLFDDVYPEGSERQRAVAFAQTLGDEAALDAYLHEYMAMLFYDPEKRDAFVALSSAFYYTQTVNETLNADLQRFDLNPELPKFRFPTLVVTGRFDMNVAPSVAFKIHQAIPGSRLAVFERSGHLPWYEEPDAFRALLAEFLAGP
jgi:proline iminopeptidase